MIIKKVSFGIVLFVALFSTQIQASNFSESSYYEIILEPAKITDYLPDWAASWMNLTTADRVRRMYIGTESYINSLFRQPRIPWTDSDVDKFVRSYNNFINRYKDIIDKEFVVFRSDQHKRMLPKTVRDIEGIWRDFYYFRSSESGNKFAHQAAKRIADNIDGLTVKSIQRLLGLPEDASDQVVHNAYIKACIENFDPEKIEKRVKKGEFSSKDVHKRIRAGKRLKEAYAQYNAQQHTPSQSLEACLDISGYMVGYYKEHKDYFRFKYEMFMKNFDPTKLNKMVEKGFLSKEDVVRIGKSADYLTKMYEKEYGTNK